MIGKEKRSSKDSLFSFFRPYRGRIVWLSVLTLLQSLLQVMMALMSRFVIDTALEDKGNLVLWGSVLVANLLALVCVHGVLSWCTGSTADVMSAKLRGQMLKTAVFSRDKKLLDYHSGQLLSRGIEDVFTVCDGAVNVLPSLVGQISRLVATFAAVLLISPAVAGVLLAAAAVVGAATACVRPVLRKRHKLVRETDEKVMAAMQEDLQQLELIQSMQVQDSILQRFRDTLDANLQTRLKRRVWSVGSSSILSTATQLGSGVLLLWGATKVAGQSLSYGSLTAMLQLLTLFRGPVLGLSGLWTRLASVEIAAERLEELLSPEQPVKPLSSEPEVQAVVFENVTFAYPGEEPVLENFNFRFPLDGWTCLTGISGRGKTTIFKLILGLYAPQAGRIYLLTDQGEMPCTEQTRQLFAYVPQDYTLFSGTILENLQLVAPDLDTDTLRQVLAASQADFVWDMADQQYTQVRENNAGLSKGQLQRLAIARAILMDRQVFLLDECTSALDAQTEDLVLQGLHKLGKHAILVTHRPEALSRLEGITAVTMEE